MTTRDYKTLIKVLVNTDAQRNTTVIGYVNSLLVHLCEALERENPRFDKEVFYGALNKALEGKE